LRPYISVSIFADKKLDVGFIVVGFPFPISVTFYSLAVAALDSDKPEIWSGDINNQSQDLLVFVDAR